MKKAINCIISLIMVATMVMASCIPVFSAGSQTLVQNEGYRAYLEYYCDGSTTAGITRKTIVNIYLKAGEKLYLGSSVYNSQLDDSDTYKSSETGSDIVLIKPTGDKISFDVIQNGAGHIGTVAKESAGPNIDGSNPDGYTPLSFTASEDGIYQLLYHSKTGKNSNPTAKLTSEQWAQSDSTVGAWDATIIDTSGKIKNGRTYTKCLSLNMGNNKYNGKFMQLNSSVYVVTTDGYIYETDFNGMNPYGFIFFANNRGLVSVDSNYSLYQSFVSNDNQLSDLKVQGATYQNPWNDDTEMDKTFNIFFEKPDPELEGILYPTSYEPETAKNLSFVGSRGDDHTHVGYGGYFKFDITNASSATVKIDLTNVAMGDGSFANYGTVEISNPVTPGTNYFYWNGCGEDGTVIPVGTYDNSSIKVTVETHSGEYHFPLFDVEMAANGVKVTRINKIYKEDVDANGNIYNKDVSSEFEDKKAYLYYNNESRLSATDSFANPAKTIADNANHMDGVDSSDGAMKFGTIGDKYAGDQTALDMWTYSNNGSPLTVTLDTPIIIDDDKYSILYGRVFYDNNYSSLTATNNTFDLNNGDYMLSGIEVKLDYDYTDATGTVHNESIITKTDSSGKYFFTGIPVMENGNPTTCIVTVIKPLLSYEVTTEKTTTNGELTLGAENQSVVLGGLGEGNLNYIPAIALSDVGYHYSRITKSLTINKDWVTDISSDSMRPESVDISVNSYYMDAGNKIQKSTYVYTLSNANHWSITATNLPAFVDYEEMQALSYEIASETYTMRGSGGATYTFSVGDDPIDFPYSTNFTKQETLTSTVLTAVNSPKTGTFQITKRDSDNSEILLSNVEFILWEETLLTEIPTGSETDYRKIETTIYHKVKTEKTNENGILTFSNLAVNSYFAIETVAKPGYMLNSEIYKFSVSAEQMHTAQTVYNTKKDPTVTVIKKVDSVIDGESVPITVSYADNAEFQDAITHDYTVNVASGKLVYQVCSFDIPGGSYVKVTEGITEYIFDSALSAVTDTDNLSIISETYESGQAVQLESGRNYTITLNNKAPVNSAKYSMTVNKIDGNTNTALSGAEFTLYSDSEFVNAISSKITALDCNDKATAIFDKLEPGTYYLKETVAPSGYLLPSDAIIITISDGGIVTANGTELTVDSNAFSVTVSNYLGITFPQTGSGISAISIMLAGLLICFLSVFVTFIVGKRQHQ